MTMAGLALHRRKDEQPDCSFTTATPPHPARRLLPAEGHRRARIWFGWLTVHAQADLSALREVSLRIPSSLVPTEGSVGAR